MIRNILLSAFASLKRKKMASFFTILTICLGMTMIVLLASVYNSYTGNIGPYKNRNRSLYLANMKFIQSGEIVQRERSKNATASFIDEYLRRLKTPEIIGMYGRPVQWNLGTRYKPYHVKYLETDANFWKIHQFNFLDGRAFVQKEVEQKEPVCILSKKAADFLFKDGNAVGKYYQHKKRNFRIVGIIQNEHPHFDVTADLYIPYTLTVWDEGNAYDNSRTKQKVYYNRGAYKGVLLVDNNTSLSSVKEEFIQLAKRINSQNEVEEFDEIYSELQSPAQLIPELLFPGGDGLDITIILIMGLCFLLVPIVILSNINLYALRDRIEEIGIRKSYGASRKLVVLQFLIENILITLIGGIAALFLAVPLNKILSNIIFQRAEIVGMEFNLTFFILLICGAFIFGLVTIVIPAVRISRILPVVAINHQVQNSTTGFSFKSRKKWLQVLSHFILFSVLTLFAFFISYISINTFSGVGFNPKNTIVIMLDIIGSENHSDDYNRTRFKGLREKILQIPEVEQVSYVLENPPSWIVPQYQKYTFNGNDTEIRTLETDTCFFKLLEIKATKGELYTGIINHGKYIHGVATTEAEHKFFDGDAIGKVITRKQDGKKIKIIGVIQKYKHHPQSLDYNGIFTCRNQPSRSVLIKYNSKSNLGILGDKIKERIDTNFSNVFISHNKAIEVSFNQDIEKMKPPFYGVLLAISFLLINTLLGFFTLIWYNVNSRKMELGIRRAVGANETLIQRKILLENMIFMLIGSAISTLLLSQILMNILPKRKIQFFWIGLLGAFVVSFFMTLISALVPALKAAKVQPVEALSEE